MAGKRNSSSNVKSKNSNPGKDLSASYNTFKEFEGKQYTGMKVGRSHHWHYDKGDWKETKITPDLWKISYEVIKRRAGRAPEGSGVPVGTEYHWYILSDQLVKKLDANSYSTSLHGYKYKLAHKRADKDKWSITEKGQRKRLIRILSDLIKELEKEPMKENKPSSAVKSKSSLPVKKSSRTSVKREEALAEA
jgi:hypothetical protein